MPSPPGARLLPPEAPGVGLVWWPALAPLVAPGTDLVSVLEVEPQAFWELVAHGGQPHYRANEALFEQVAAMQQRTRSIPGPCGGRPWNG